MKFTWIKSFFPFLLMGIIFSFLFFDYFKDITHAIFFLGVIFLHYIFFLVLGVFFLSVFSKKRLFKYLTQIIFYIIFVLISIISIGSYISINNWHSPINMILIEDFVDNAKFYISSFLDINIVLFTICLLVLSIILYWFLKRFNEYHFRVIDQLKKKSFLSIFLVGFGFLFFSAYIFFNTLFPSIFLLKENYILHDPVGHFYFTSFMRLRVTSNVKEKEDFFLMQLKEEYSAKDISVTKKKKNVILFTIDALRADYLPAYGFPEEITPYIDSFLLKNKHIIVKDPLAVSNYSVCGISSILESSASNQLGIKRLGIQNYLDFWGYQNNFILGGNHAALGYLDIMYGNTLNYYFDGTDAKGFSPTDDNILPYGLKSFFKENKEWDKKPNFFWFHLMSVHYIGKRDSIFKKYNPSEMITMFPNKGNIEKDIYINRYKNGILKADYIFKILIEQLKEKGILENAAIVITSDHGESLGEDGYFSHSNRLTYSELNIPFIIIDNDLEETKKISFATQLDVAPTIVDFVRLPVPKNWKGQSVLSQNKKRFIPLFASKKNEFGIATRYKDKWLALIKNKNRKKYIIMDKEMEEIPEKIISDTLRKRMLFEYESYFSKNIIK